MIQKGNEMAKPAIRTPASTPLAEAPFK